MGCQWFIYKKIDYEPQIEVWSFLAFPVPQLASAMNSENSRK